MKIDRLLSIVILLLENDLISANELAKRFSVSVRTIQRDMDTLSLAGIPLYAQTGQTGGYGIMPEYKINNRLLSNEDIMNLITALKGIQGTFADKRFLGSLEQIYSLVPAHLYDTVMERENTLFIDYSLTGNDSILAGKIKTIEQAINRKLLITCSYTGHRQETLVRTIEPMTLILQWGSWYVYAFCRMRSDFRLFKISRIHNIRVENDHYVRREKTYQEFVSENRTFRNQTLIDLVFVANASVRAYVEENHPGQELDYQNDGSIIVRCRQPEEERMYRYLLSYGNEIKIIEPLRVKEHVQKIAEKILTG